jgi:RNA polymerase sigma factor (sigma-70 family)
MISTNITTLLRDNREEAFRQLYDCCYPQVLRLVKLHGGQAAEARDVFHDALIILYEKHLSGQLDFSGSPTAYLVGIAKHLWRRQSGKRGRQIPFSHFERGLEAYAVPIADQPEKPRLRLFKFLTVAGRRCLDILQAFYYQQTPLPKIAEEFGFSNTRSATVQKHKCLKKIQTAIQEKQLDYEAVVD